MTTDAELLRRYAEEKSEAAFGELVRRQVNLVYAVALRQCGGDASLAQDVTQRVFTDLARKARQLSGHAMLGGWLYRSAWFAASDVVRAERRRRAREQEAQAMQDAAKPAATEADWKNLAPLLDQAVGELAERDRDAVVARFFEGKSFGEIGATLRLSEDAARMRVERALEKLRAGLGRRGVTSTAAALGLALANQVAAAAPAGIAASITGTALTAAAEAGGAGLLAGLFAMNKLQIGAAALLTVVGVGLLTVELGARRALAVELVQVREQNAALAALPPIPGVPARTTSAAVTPSAPAAAPVLPPLSAEAEERQAQLTALRVAGMKPDETWENLGRGTPAAALETMLWAWRRQDYAALGDSLRFDLLAKAGLDAWFATLPEDVRAKHGTPERIVAPAFARWVTPLAGLGASTYGGKKALGFRIVPLPSGPLVTGGEGQLAVLFSTKSDVTKPDLVNFIQDGTGWRQGPLSESMVRTFTADIDPTTGELRPAKP